MLTLGVMGAFQNELKLGSTFLRAPGAAAGGFDEDAIFGLDGKGGAAVEWC